MTPPRLAPMRVVNATARKDSRTVVLLNGKEFPADVSVALDVEVDVHPDDREFWEAAVGAGRLMALNEDGQRAMNRLREILEDLVIWVDTDGVCEVEGPCECPFHTAVTTLGRTA